MILSPVVAMLHNTKLDRWHPIIFRESPLPGGSKLIRHKSQSHHTEGFPTREEACVAVPDLVQRLKDGAVGSVRVFIEDDMEWDGEGIPARVEFFPPEQ